MFIEKCIANGAREQAYHGIFASGEAAATLHYVKNYEPLEGKLNLLLDAGGEYGCYASDIASLPFLEPGHDANLKADKDVPNLRHFLARIESHL